MQGCELPHAGSRRTPVYRSVPNPKLTRSIRSALARYGLCVFANFRTNLQIRARKPCSVVMGAAAQSLARPFASVVRFAESLAEVLDSLVWPARAWSRVVADLRDVRCCDGSARRRRSGRVERRQTQHE